MAERVIFACNACRVDFSRRISLRERQDTALHASPRHVEIRRINLIAPMECHRRWSLVAADSQRNGNFVVPY